MKKANSGKKINYLVGTRKAKTLIEDVKKQISGIDGVKVLRWGKASLLFSSTPTVMKVVEKKINKTCVIGKEVTFRAI